MAKVRTIKTHLFLFSLSFFVLTQKRTKKGQGKKMLPRSCLHTTSPFCRANALQVSLPRFRQSMEEIDRANCAC